MKTAAIALGALGLSLALTACGSASDTTPTNSAPTQDPTSAETVAGSDSTPADSDTLTTPTPSPTPEATSAAPEDSFEGEVVDLGTVEVSVGDRIGIPVPNDLMFNGDPAVWNFQLELDPLVQQADLNREDVGEFLFVAEPTAEESALSYDIVAAGEGAVRISFTNPDSGESTMIVTYVLAK